MKKLLFLLSLILLSCNNHKEKEGVPGVSLWSYNGIHYDNHKCYENIIKQTHHAYITKDSVYFVYVKDCYGYWVYPNINLIYLKYPNKIVKIIPKTYKDYAILDNHAQYIALSINDILYGPKPVKIRFITNDEVIDGGPIYNEFLINTINAFLFLENEKEQKRIKEEQRQRIKDSINSIKLNNHLYEF